MTVTLVINAVMLSSLRASLSRLSLTTTALPKPATGTKLPGCALRPEVTTVSPLSSVMSTREYRSRAPSSTHVNGYYQAPPSKHDVWYISHFAKFYVFMITNPLFVVRSKRYSLHDYCRLVNPLTGERQGMTTAFWRFKRLDWGHYIRMKAGAYRKQWKRDPYRLWQREAHVFCKKFHVNRFERMFHPEWKEKRHIPDDPYEKYNKV